MNREKRTRYVAHISSYPPRECGIATFTNDLTNALDRKFNPAVKSAIIALNETPSALYAYPKKVHAELASTDLPRYVELAKALNKNPDVRLVNIQHEFGLFGGEWGNYLIPFLQTIEKPVVTTFHSVLPRPNAHLKRAVQDIAKKSNAVVVMNTHSEKLLAADYAIPASKIRLIPHGIPSVAFTPPLPHKKELGLEDRLVTSTFGLLSPNKGVEYALRALPKVIRRFPNFLYLILGETHPMVRKHEGEEYRNFLMREVERLNLKNHVKFCNKYLEAGEITRYLQASDIYLSPTLDQNQSVSGTISWALGCGRPVISTGTVYAQYLIRSGVNGVLVKPKNARALGNAVIALLSDPKQMKAMSAAAYEASRPMIWPNVADRYFKTYQKIADLEPERKLPELKLDHLFRMTDSFGIFHHARYAAPEPRYGYSLDDNARALIAAAAAYETNPAPSLAGYMHTYLKFMRFALRKDGTFANIVSYRKRRDKSRDEDVQGRALLALGTAAFNPSLPPAIRTSARALLRKSIAHATRLRSPRAIAFAIGGLHTLLEHSKNPAPARTLKKYADALVALYRKTAVPEWQWFENHLTYSNSKLPEALYLAYAATKKKEYLDVAEQSLAFLSSITLGGEHYAPIGQNGWYFRNKTRAYFDQQPEDTASMVETKLAAYKITKNKKHLEDAYKAFKWFLGENHLHQMVYDESTGGCHDGLGEHSMNLNEGAESTVSYLLARLAFENHAILKSLNI